MLQIGTKNAGVSYKTKKIFLEMLNDNINHVIKRVEKIMETRLLLAIAIIFMQRDVNN